MSTSAATRPGDTSGSGSVVPVGSGPRRAARRGGGADRAGITPWLFLAPFLTLFIVFVIVPAFLGAWISLHNWDYTLPGKPFVGLDNYLRLFDPSTFAFTTFWESMRATAIFTVFSVPLLLVVPLLVALLMNQAFPGRNLFRAAFFAPYVLGVAVIGILWRYLLDANIGLVNYYAGLVGLPDNTAWTTSSPAVWVTLVGVTVWWTLGFNAVIYLAGLQDIDKQLYEAARVDGANSWQQFWNVTFPSLKPVLSFVTLITIIASANMFGQSYLLTEGGLGTLTRTAIYQIAETGLRNYRMGEAAAMSYVLTFFLVLLSLGVVMLFRERKA